MHDSGFRVPKDASKLNRLFKAFATVYVESRNRDDIDSSNIVAMIYYMTIHCAELFPPGQEPQNCHISHLKAYIEMI